MSVIPSSPAAGITRKTFRLAAAGLGVYAAGRSSGYKAGRRSNRRGRGKSKGHGKSILFWIVVFLIILAFFHP